MKLTDWYPGSVLPVRDGVYQRMYTGGTIHYCNYRKWTWHFADDSPEVAHTMESWSLNQSLPWRGVAK